VDYRLLFTQRALNDLAEIIGHIAEEDDDAASRFGNALLDHVDLLTRFPRMGSTIRKRSRVETSPGNFQAWLNHGEVLPKELSTFAARHLARRFLGDPASADWRHYGRLAGFTNRKERYRRENGLFPFVLLHEASGLPYRRAPEFLAEIEERFKEAKRRMMPEKHPGTLATQISL